MHCECVCEWEHVLSVTPTHKYQQHKSTQGPCQSLQTGGDHRPAKGATSQRNTLTKASQQGRKGWLDVHRGNVSKKRSKCLISENRISSQVTLNDKAGIFIMLELKFLKIWWLNTSVPNNTAASVSWSRNESPQLTMTDAATSPSRTRGWEGRRAVQRHRARSVPRPESQPICTC